MYMYSLSPNPTSHIHIHVFTLTESYLTYACIAFTLTNNDSPIFVQALRDKQDLMTWTQTEVC